MSTSAPAAPAALLPAPEDQKARQNFDETARCFDSGLRLNHDELSGLIDSLERQDVVLPGALAKRLESARAESRRGIIQFLNSVGREAPSA